MFMPITTHVRRQMNEIEKEHGFVQRLQKQSLQTTYHAALQTAKGEGG